MSQSSDFVGKKENENRVSLDSINIEKMSYTDIQLGRKPNK